MKIGPLQISFDRQTKEPMGDLPARDMNAQGPWTGMFHDWVPREQNPYLYENLRYAIPFLDAAIDWLVTMDGLIRAEANTDAIQRELDDWMVGVLVNDVERGLQSFYSGMAEEEYEQGFALGEPVMRRDGGDVVRLRVADSKGVVFKRQRNGRLETWYRPPGVDMDRSGGVDSVVRTLRNAHKRGQQPSDVGFHRLDNPEVLVHQVHRPEGGNPYGASILRSLPFVARVFLTIENAQQRAWERFGDPPIHATYKVGSRADHNIIEAREKKLSKIISSVMDGKAKGYSQDIVNAIGPKDEISIKVIGADGQTLEIAEPARHFAENMVAKLRLPAWLLGFHWSTAERLAAKQSELLLQDSRTRFEARKPHLMRIIEDMLRARGVSFRRGDFQLFQELPNITDEQAKAQAEFLRAQAEMVRRDVQDEGEDGVRSGERSARAVVTRNGEVKLPTDPDYPGPPIESRRRERESCKPDRHKEPFAEDDPELDKLEAEAEKSLLGSWEELEERVIELLDLPNPGKSEDEWKYDMERDQDLRKAAEDMVERAGASDGEYLRNIRAAMERGIINAASEEGVADQVGQRVRDRRADAILRTARRQIEDTVERDFVEDVLARLEEGVYDGLNPREVASRIRQRFDAHDYNWKRTAHTEIAEAQFSGKLTQYAENGLDEYDWVTASAACPICLSLEANGPYPVGAGPTPKQDSHPECRCSTRAHQRD